MNVSDRGSPMNAGQVPFVFDGVNLIFSWIKSCEILCVVSKKKLREFIGPLAALVFNGSSEDGEANREVYLKIIGQTWTISVALFHWPKGSAVPYELHFPTDALGSATLSGGEGAYVTWDDRVRQEIKRFRIRRTLKDEVRLWQHSHCMTTSCKALVCVVADDVDGENMEAPPPGTARVEGDLRAAALAARQIEAAEMTAGEVGEMGQPIRINVIRYGSILEYKGRIYEFGGLKRWEAVEKLISAGGEYVRVDRGFKSLFANNPKATAFFEAAVEPEGKGRNGTHGYRLKK